MFQQIVKLVGAICTPVGAALGTFALATHSFALQVTGVVIAAVGGGCSAFSTKIGGDK